MPMVTGMVRGSGGSSQYVGTPDCVSPVSLLDGYGGDNEDVLSLIGKTCDNYVRESQIVSLIPGYSARLGGLVTHR